MEAKLTRREEFQLSDTMKVTLNSFDRGERYIVNIAVGRISVQCHVAGSAWERFLAAASNFHSIEVLESEMDTTEPTEFSVKFHAFNGAPLEASWILLGRVAKVGGAGNWITAQWSDETWTPIAAFVNERARLLPECFELSPDARGALEKLRATPTGELPRQGA